MGNQHKKIMVETIGYYSSSFIDDFHGLADIAHTNAVNKGFWEGAQNDAEKIALMHSELSEALEALREGDPPDKHCPEFSGAEVELADTVIRIMDFAAGRSLDVGGAIIAKMNYNLTRPHKHGKKF